MKQPVNLAHVVGYCLVFITNAHDESQQRKATTELDAILDQRPPAGRRADFISDSLNVEPNAARLDLYGFAILYGLFFDALRADCDASLNAYKLAYRAQLYELANRFTAATEILLVIKYPSNL
jgi:hypothetical protein